MCAVFTLLCMWYEEGRDDKEWLSRDFDGCNRFQPPQSIENWLLQCFCQTVRMCRSIYPNRWTDSIQIRYLRFIKHLSVPGEYGRSIVKNMGALHRGPRNAKLWFPRKRLLTILVRFQ